MKDADSLLGESDVNKPRKFKLPGSDRKGPRAQKAAEPVVKKSVPESMAKHWAGDDMDEITRSMNDFALQIIGANLAEIEERDKKDAAAAARKEAASAASPQRFKPKPPAKRYAERHPEPVAAQQQTARTADPEGYETASEDEYVVETYVRVPASSLLGKDMAPGKVGLLVFDNEPDADYFYGEEGDSDDEWPEDDEDENGNALTYPILFVSHSLTSNQPRTTTPPTTQMTKSIRTTSMIEAPMIIVQAMPLTWRSSTSAMTMSML